MGTLATPSALGIAFFGIALLITWPLATCADRCLSGNLGDPLLNAWIVGWGADRLADGLRGVWDAPIFHPHDDTLAYSEHLLGIAALVAPVYWLSENAILAYNVAFIAAYALAALGMYLLAKQLTGRMDVSFAVALAFASSPYLTTSQTTRLQMLYCGWMAIGLAGLHGYFDTRSRARLAMFVVAYVMLGLSNMYLFVFFTIPVALVMGYGVWTSARKARTVTELAIAMTLVTGAIAPIALLYRGVQRDMTFERTVDENVRYSASVRSYASVWHESPLARWLPAETVADRALFPGLTIAALALLNVPSLMAGRRRRRQPAPDHLTFDRAPPVASGRAVHPEESESGAGRRLSHRRSWPVVYGLAVLVAFALSLGPVPHAGTEPMAEAGPYAWLMQVIPGIDGLRAPGRFGVIVLLGLGALAAMGLSAWLKGRSARVRAFVIPIVCATAIAEGAVAPPRLVSFPGTLAPAEQQAFDWLATEPPGAVLVLPILPEDFWRMPAAGVTQTLVYQYATLLHDRPIVNGSSGFKPPLVELLESDASPFRDPAHLADALHLARALGVRYVMVHERGFRDRAHMQLLTERLRAEVSHVAGEHAFGVLRIFELRPADRLAPDARPAARPIPAAHFQVLASEQLDAVDEALDGNPESRWRSSAPQSGTEWLSLDFHEAVDIARVRLSLHPGSFGDYPRRLQIVSLGADGGARTLFEGSPIVSFALGLTRRPTDRAIDIALPGNETKQLLMHQTGRSPSYPWSVHELAVWAR